MIRGLLAKEAVLLVLLMQPNHWFDSLKYTSSSKENEKNICSRERSKIVRYVLNQKLYPILEKYNVDLPIDCPFHPNREKIWWPDIYINERKPNLIQNDYKNNFLLISSYFNYLNKIKNWLCPFCGLFFDSVENLIEHWDVNHRQSFKVPDDAICLADYCEIMRCDVLINFKPFKSSQKNYIFNQPCDKDKLNDLYNSCKNLIRQCILGTLKIESSIQEFNNLQNELTDSICSYLKCEKYYESFEKTNNVSSKFFLILFFISIFLFFICFMFVWIVTEKIFKDIQVINIYKKIKDFFINMKFNSKNKLNEIEINLEPKKETKFNLKQSIFSIRSSSSDSIKKMHLEHIKNLEIHEKKMKELENKRKELENRKKENLIKEEIINEEEDHNSYNFSNDYFKPKCLELNSNNEINLYKKKFSTDDNLKEKNIMSYEQNNFNELNKLINKNSKNCFQLNNNISSVIRKRHWEIAGDITLDEVCLKMTGNQEKNQEFNFNQIYHTQNLEKNSFQNEIKNLQNSLEDKKEKKIQSLNNINHYNKRKTCLLKQNMISLKRLSIGKLNSLQNFNKTDAKKRINKSLLNHVIFHHSRSQPSSSSQTPRPYSTNSSPYR